MIDTAPESLSDLKETIKLHYPKLSKRLRQVAEFVLDAPSDVAFGTVAVLSKDAGVHPSTWVRFANAFGFSGFSEMQKLFQQKLMEEAPNYQDRIRMAREVFGDEGSDQSPAQLLSRFSHANAIALGHLGETTAPEDLDKAIQILSQAHAAHIVGVRRAFVVASYFAYALRHINQKAYLVDGVGGMFKEQGSSLDQNDVLIAVSFYPYAEETQSVAKAAAEKNVPLIVITDNQISPLASIASVCFVVKEAEIDSFRSLSSSLCLAQALSIGLAYELERKNA
ncbi:MAG: MurR/RpiR family transcriptional regulator [Marinomonas sp.]|uniref:(Fe-S)-cluster assembly protein n=1 Tax=Marinomonas pontica TaxID=264739 RepID=A0ABM8FJC2_9GAMM|nr:MULTISPECIES: MurR/RpiR family transcriptional regulator [Marinomonas]MCW8354862.1 MurR/RpiR family transcriptional regulator [Marinomonas pontica]TYL46697.1 MurR/RpiR family transcriptional regulator [Marinomonas sp. IMCC 4694]BDX04174.1 (Fe-S)-cluster assembly protein [Marinomonas pontica]